MAGLPFGILVRILSTPKPEGISSVVPKVCQIYLIPFFGRQQHLVSA